MTVPLSILYRGPLASCNYDCPYCPFAKHFSPRAELEQDRADLARFVAHLTGWTRSMRLLFTPWGEGLTRRWYREAMLELAGLEHVHRVAIQTNLSVPMAWAGAARPDKLAFWATFHPGQTTLERFLGRCDEVLATGARLSVGVVGMQEHLDAIDALRERLPDGVYVWVNAYKGVPDYYSADDLERLERVDPYFRWNLHPWRSGGEACSTGHTAISVRGDGTVKRCWFVDTELGNLYDADFETRLRPRPCPVAECRCHIGTVHLRRSGLAGIFGDGLLERIPEGWGQGNGPG